MNRMNRLSPLVPLLASLLVTTTHATPLRLDPLVEPPTAGHLQMAMDRLATVGSILYVAAHPDDENTRFLAWLAGHRGLKASYVSLTRGDGGQNLVGNELGPLLGLIRTYELMAARRIDGAEQYFTRAVDFGYSKTAEETLGLWGKNDPDAILADLVRVIRTTRPDAVIMRFSTEPPNHGHHTASALLAREAFVAAADPARFPRQVNDGVEVHAAERLLENKSHWRFKEGEDLSKYLALDVGSFSPLIGKSFAELAAASRTMHKSQGFGSAPVHGPQLEYFEVVTERGKGGGQSKDPLAGLDFTWRRFPGTDAVIKAVDEARRTFVPAAPERSIPALLKVRAALAALPAATQAGLVSFYREQKLAEVDALLVAVSGIYLDVRAKSAVAVPGEAVELTATTLLRTGGDVTLEALVWPDGSKAALAAKKLVASAPEVVTAKVVVPADRRWSTPFWLGPPREGHLFGVPSYVAIHPFGPADLKVDWVVRFGDHQVTVQVPVRFAWVDRVHGERFRPVEVLPPVAVSPRAPVLMLPNGKAQRLDVRVVAHGVARKGVVAVKAPEGWKVDGEGAFELKEPNAEVDLSFTVTPPSATASGELRLSATLDGVGSGAVVDVQKRIIDYVHVPMTTVLSPAVVRATAFKFAPGVKRIGYIVGPGDEVAAGLSAVGYEVTSLTAATLDSEDLSKFEAIVMGVRAFNEDERLAHRHPKLMRFVEMGGTYIVQYQVSSRFRPLGNIPIGPAKFSVGQGRVTDETATMKTMKAGHAAVTKPNRLDDQDFVGWVQERGLYFAESWDDSYEPVFEIADPGEESQKGAVIVARHGKGAFVYTGLAFFRQLPEGVPGAYRLFANLLSLGKNR